ncbi:MAG: hypothetical protein C5S38_07500 [Candidatus Methanophagaceae archaeon]|nr:MAG: hypothetical protein C5S38_07500 [Methanophagales archaeon]
MARYIAERGIPFYRLGLEESKRDVKEAEGWLKTFRVFYLLFPVLCPQTHF